MPESVRNPLQHQPKQSLHDQLIDGRCTQQRQVNCCLGTTAALVIQRDAGLFVGVERQAFADDSVRKAEEGQRLPDPKLEQANDVPDLSDPSKRVIYQDKMADQDAPQR